MPVLGRPAAAGLHLALSPEVLQFSAKRLSLHAARTREPWCTARQQGHCQLNPLGGAPSLAPVPRSLFEHLGHVAIGWSHRAQGDLLELCASALRGAAWTQHHIVNARLLGPSASWRAQRGLQLPQTCQEGQAQRQARPALWAAVQLGAWVGLSLRAAIALAGAAAVVLGALVTLTLDAWGLGVFPSFGGCLPFGKTAILPPRMGPELDAFARDRLAEHLRGEGAPLQAIVQPEGQTLYPWLAAFPTLSQRRDAQQPSTSPLPSPTAGLLHTSGPELTEVIQWDTLNELERDFFAPLGSQAVLLQLLHGDRCHPTPSPILCRTGRAYSDVPPDVAYVRILRGAKPDTFDIKAKLAWLGELGPTYRYRLRSAHGEDQEANPEQLPQLTFEVLATVTTALGDQGQLQLRALDAHVRVDSVGACLTHPALPRAKAGI